MILPFLSGFTIDLTKIPKYLFLKKEFSETVDYRLAQLILNTKGVDRETGKELFHPNAIKCFRKLLARVDPKTNTLKVHYSGRRNNLGRRYPDIPDEYNARGLLNPDFEKYSSALIAMPRVIKNTLFAYSNWIDIDMVKGHPSIVYEMGRANGKEMGGFKAYLESFEGAKPNVFLADIIQFYQAVDSPVPVTETDIKDLFNITIYGGGLSTWVKQIETGVYRNELGEVTYIKDVTPLLKNKDKKHPYYQQFEDESREMMEKIYKENVALQETVCVDLPKIISTDRKKVEEREHKRMRRVMSYACGIFEVHITSIVFEYLSDRKRKFIKDCRCSWGHDGLTFPTPQGVDIDKMIRQVNTHIQKEIQAEKIRYVRKEFKEEEVLTTLINARNLFHDDDVIDNLVKIQYTGGGISIDKIDKQLEDFHKPTFDGFQVIHEQNKYLSSDVSLPISDTEIAILRKEVGLKESESDDIFYMCKYLVLLAIMGGGKTTALKRLIKHYFQQSKSKHIILWVSPRVAFSYFIETLFAEFNPFLYFNLHNDGEENVSKVVDQDPDLRFFICQVESLKLVPTQYEVIVLDEIESILDQFSSLETMRGKFTPIFNILKNQILSAKKVIGADAFLSDKSMDFLRNMKDIDHETGVVIMNHTLPEKTKAIEIHPDKVIEKLFKLLEEGKNVFVSCASATLLRKILDQIIGYNRGKSNPIMYKIHHGDRASKQQDEEFKHINEVWSLHAFVGVSPVCTVGQSFDRIHFHVAVLIGWPSNHIKAQMQTSKRVRHLIDKIVYFSIPSNNALGQYHSKHKDDIMTYETFEVNTKTRADAIDRLMRNTKSVKELGGDASFQEQITLLSGVTDPILQKILYRNLQEVALSRCYYRKSIIHFLRKQRYDIQFLPPSKSNEMKAGAAMTKEERDAIIWQRWNAIRDVNYDEVTCLIEFKKMRMTDEDDVQLIIDKYKFLKNYDLPTEIDSEEDMKRIIDGAKIFFDRFSGIFHHVFTEKGYHLMNLKLKEYYIRNLAETENGNATGNGALMSNTPDKLKHIIHILSLLGLKHSQDCETVTNISEECIQYLTMHRHDLIKFFKPNKKDKNKDGTTEKDLAQKLLNSIFLNWSGMRYCKVENDSEDRVLCAKRDNTSTKGIVFYDYIRLGGPNTENIPAIDPSFLLPPAPKPSIIKEVVDVKTDIYFFDDNQPFLLSPPVVIECY